MHKLKTGVIGLYGHSTYAYELLRHPSVEPVGIADHPQKGFSTLKECRLLAKEHKIPFFERYTELIKEVPMDVCAVMCPWAKAPDIVVELASKGVNILSEKPVSGSLEGAEKIAEAVTRNRIIYTACLPLPKVYPSFKSAYALLQSGKIGRPLTANFTYLQTKGPLYTTSTPHYRNPSLPEDSLSGGEMSMFSGYGIVTLQYFTGQRISEVYARADTYFYKGYKDLNVEDLGFVSLRFSDGAIGSLLLGRIPAVSEPYARIELDVTGTDGTIRVDRPFSTVTTFERYTGNKELTEDPGGMKEYVVDNITVKDFIDDFVRAVGEKREPLVTFRECMDTISVLDAIYRSVATGEIEKVSPLID
jgi:predicted dehydrogenase